MCVELIDKSGIGCGASGVSGGLLHPYSPKGSFIDFYSSAPMYRQARWAAGKVLWRGMEAWRDAVSLVTIAENVAEGEDASQQIVWKR